MWSELNKKTAHLMVTVEIEGIFRIYQRPDFCVDLLANTSKRGCYCIDLVKGILLETILMITLDVHCPLVHHSIIVDPLSQLCR